MDTAIVIHGIISAKQFISDEPMPDVEGPAELIVYPKDAAKPILLNKLAPFDLSTKWQDTEN